MRCGFAVALAVLVSAAVSLALLVSVALLLAASFAGSVAGAVSVAVSLALAVSVALLLAVFRFAVALAVAVSVAVLAAVSLALLVPVALLLAASFAGSVAGAVSVAVSLAGAVSVALLLAVSVAVAGLWKFSFVGRRRFITRHRPRSSRLNVNAAVGRRSLRQVDSAVGHVHLRVVGDSGEVAEFRRALGVGGVKIRAAHRHDRVGRMHLVIDRSAAGPVHNRSQCAGSQADPRRRGAASDVLVERDHGRRADFEPAPVGQDDDAVPIRAGNYLIAPVNRRARCGS
jgi:hypothetical protein